MKNKTHIEAKNIPMAIVAIGGMKKGIVLSAMTATFIRRLKRMRPSKKPD